MAKINWTPSQKAAIDARGSALAVSAAAGSGKTATLSGRIVELIVSGRANLSQMLIVTFTRASAGEMREYTRQRFATAANASSVIS